LNPVAGNWVNGINQEGGEGGERFSPAAFQGKELKMEMIFKIRLPWLLELTIVYRRVQHS